MDMFFTSNMLLLLISLSFTMSNAAFTFEGREPTGANCEANGKTSKSQDECSTLATTTYPASMWGLQTVNSPYLPKGCVAKYPQIVWNYHDTGAACSTSQKCICKDACTTTNPANSVSAEFNTDCTVTNFACNQGYYEDFYTMECAPFVTTTDKYYTNGTHSYNYTEIQSDTCAVGWSTINSLDDCSFAVGQFNLGQVWGYGGVYDVTTGPQGCYFDSVARQIRFNPTSNDECTSDQKCLCVHHRECTVEHGTPTCQDGQLVSVLCDEGYYNVGNNKCRLQDPCVGVFEDYTSANGWDVDLCGTASADTRCKKVLYSEKCACPSSKISTESTCTYDCPDGYFCTVGGTVDGAPCTSTSFNCIARPCPEGFTCVNGLQIACAGVTVEQYDPENPETPLTGSRMVVNNRCTGFCPDGFDCGESGNCTNGERCIANELSNLEIREPCPIGKYTLLHIYGQCNECPAGSYSDEPGAYYTEEGSTGCKYCTMGRYQDNTGTDGCKHCTVGRYQNNIGNAGCKSCGVSRTSPLEAKSESECTYCHLGTMQTGSGKCENCEAGKYGNCFQDCWYGTYSNAGAPTCNQCPTGYHGKSGVKSECTQCDIGRYQDTTGEENCNPCVTGTYSAAGASSCKGDCNAGFYITGDKSACRSCPEGKYQNQNDQSSCKTCGIGKHNNQIEQTSESSCESCGTGKYNGQQGQSSCKLCGSGQYQDDSGESSCKVCVGATIDDNGVCTPCQIGKEIVVSPAAYQYCRNCQLGQYQDQLWQSECKLCPAGQASNTMNADMVRLSCEPCSGRKVDPRTNQWSTRGYYTHVTGLAECIHCPAGKYQDEDGKPDCKSGY